MSWLTSSMNFVLPGSHGLIFQNRIEFLIGLILRTFWKICLSMVNIFTNLVTMLRSRARGKKKLLTFSVILFTFLKVFGDLNEWFASRFLLRGGPTIPPQSPTLKIWSLSQIFHEAGLLITARVLCNLWPLSIFERYKQLGFYAVLCLFLSRSQFKRFWGHSSGYNSWARISWNISG